MPNLKLIKSIINYFKEEAEKPDTSPDTKESLEVAVQCLQTAYDIDSDRGDADSTLPFSIEDIFEAASLSFESSNAASNADKLQRAEMMKNVGNNFMKSNQFNEAVKCYTAAIDLDNQNAIYYGNRAAAYSKLNDFHHAIRDCDKAIQIDPKYAKAYGRMGLAYASLEEHDAAIKAFKQAVELDPGNESYQSNLKIAQEKKDKPPTPPSNSMGGLAGLSSVDWHTLFTNPAFRNMASTLIQDPNIISALSASMASSLNQATPTPPPPPSFAAGGDASAGLPSQSENPGNRNLDMLLEAGQYLAAQMQAANPDLVEQFRQTTNRTFGRQNRDNTDSSTQ